MKNWPPKPPELNCPGCGVEINTEEHRGDCVWQAAIRERQERHRLSTLRHRTELAAAEDDA